jgi:hypothetical protein
LNIGKLFIGLKINKNWTSSVFRSIDQYSD